jgi:lysozyme
VRYTSYKDTVGLWTIGYGHLLGDKQRMTEITFSEAEALLDSDIKQAEAIVRRLVQQATSAGAAMLGQSRERALVNMAFNLGQRLGGFKKFLAAVNANDWANAAIEMMESKWAVQVGDRAKRLRDMILTDD